ncbi:MAG: hypothetical protein JRJ78_15680, partial [Deltaproteobacteria bacterium]|nr:hypothetical protein [Deltaproteobacteria bacterium]
KESAKQWAEQGVDTQEVFGATTIGKMKAVVQLATSLQDLQGIERTALHEWYHIAKAWLIPEKDAQKVSRHFTNEEEEADAFADFVMNRKRDHGHGFVHRVWRKLRRMLQIIRNGLKGKGFTRPEDFFGTLAVGGYSMRGETSQAESTQIAKKKKEKVESPTQQERESTRLQARKSAPEEETPPNPSDYLSVLKKSKDAAKTARFRHTLNRMRNGRIAAAYDILTGKVPTEDIRGPGAFAIFRNIESILSQTRPTRLIYEQMRRFKEKLAGDYDSFKGRKDAALTGLSAKEKAEVLRILDGRGPDEPSDRVAKAAKNIRSLLDDVWKFLADHGSEIAYRKDFLPHVFHGRFWAKEKGGFARKFETLTEAMAYAKSNPDKDISIWQDTQIHGDEATLLSRKAYGKLISEIREAVGEKAEVLTADEVKALLSGKVAPKPRKRFFGHAMQRLVDNPNYLRDLDKLLDIYLYGAVRKVHQDKLLNVVAKQMEKMPKGHRRLKDFIENEALPAALGYPTALEENIAIALHKTKILAGTTGQDVRRMLHNINLLQYVHDLGVSISSIAANSSQVIMNTYPIVGERAFIAGYRAAKGAMRDPAKLRELRKVGVVQGVSAITGEVLPHQKGLKGWAKRSVGAEGLKGSLEASLEPFGKVEVLNRTATYYAGKSYAKVKLMKGADPVKLADKVAPKTSSLHALARQIKNNDSAALREAFAMGFGKELVDKTQFRVGRENLPGILRKAPVRLLSPYKSFLLNQLKYSVEALSPKGIAKDPKKALRFAGVTFGLVGAMGNPVLALYYLAAKAIAEAVWGRDLDDDLEDLGLKRGLLGKIGLDISGSIAVNLPQKLEDLLGWYGKAAKESLTLLYQKLTDQGTIFTERKLKRMAMPVQAQRAYDTIKIMLEGEYRTPITGMPIETDDSPAVTAVKRFFGILPEGVARYYDNAKKLDDRKKRFQSLSRDWTERWSEAVKTGDMVGQARVIGEVVRRANKALDQMMSPKGPKEFEDALTELLFLSSWVENDDKFLEALRRKTLPAGVTKARKAPKYMRHEYMREVLK